MTRPSAPPDRIEPPPAGRPWAVLHLVRWSAQYLEDRGLERGRLDAEHLLADALGTERLGLYLQYDRPLADDELGAFKSRLLRRARREPVQYIIGHAGFRELRLRTDRRVLIPRPETEVLVQIVLDWAAGQERQDVTALDVGTGSGAIALSLALEGPFGSVVATDASDEALSVARLNREDAGLFGTVELRLGTLYEPVRDERFDVVVSNPPYVTEGEALELDPEVGEWEPSRALLAGVDGLDVLRPLVDGAPVHLCAGGLLAVEVGLGQAETVAERMDATEGLLDACVHRDLTGRPRVVTARRSG